MPSKEGEKNEPRKAKEGGREKTKRKNQDCCVTFKPNNYLKTLLSSYTQTLQANILHLDKKAAKCMI